MNKTKLISKIRSATLTLCIDNGINDPKMAKELLKAAKDSVGKMSIAGVKAAMKKGQVFHCIGEMTERAR
jgi:hypothetical protein